MKNLGLTVQRVDSVKSVARSGLCLSGRLAQPYNIEAFEIPIPQSNIVGYLEIQRGCEMPITIHFGNPDPVKAIKAWHERLVHHRLSRLTSRQRQT